MGLAQLQNQIRIEARNAQFAVQQNRARVDAANVAVELARRSLDAEQKKYAFGASTNTLALQPLRDLVQAESNAVAARTSYQKSRVKLDRATARSLNSLGIDVQDAESGNVTRAAQRAGHSGTGELAPSAAATVIDIGGIQLCTYMNSVGHRFGKSSSSSRFNV